ncbi:unnamed protein product [Oreochromis niloticus]|nr:unnamed protein product [Mustela putorius furo]
MMQTVLKDLPGVRNYLDDIIVYGTSKEVHDTRLQAVLQRLRDVGLQINTGKSSFCQSHITFLGHVMSKEGLRPSQHHLTAIAEAPAPKDMAALRSFLGLSSWFSKFIPDYATLVEPLRQLLKTDMKVELQSNEAAHESFSNLKKLLLKSPALATYDPDLPAFITTDASDYGLGAVLTQLHPDQVERVVAFASRTLSPAKNVTADCLSRVPLTYSSTDIDAEKDLLLEIAEVSPLLTATPLSDFKAECEDCPDLSLLRQVIRSGWPKVKKFLPARMQPYFMVRHELAVESPLVFRGTRLVVPRSLREKVICLAHEGHQGIVRTKQRLRELYWWPSMDTQVHAILSSCSVCQACDKTANTVPAPLQPVQFPDGPFQHVAVDIGDMGDQ